MPKIILRLSVLLSMIIIISLEVYQISKLSKTLSSIFANQTNDINNQNPKSSKFINHCKNSYIWCLNNCYRHISRRYGVTEDYDNCKYKCQLAFGNNHDKKVDF